MTGTAYLDYNATTPVDRRVLDRLTPFFSTRFGNPASAEHSIGWDASDATERARDFVADLIGARPTEIVFTSSATESICFAILGIFPRGGLHRLYVSAAEHAAVLTAARVAECNRGAVARYFANNSAEILSHFFSADASTARSGSMVAVGLANNELGTIADLQSLSNIGHAGRAIFFSDITQAVGKIPVDVRALGIDLAAFSAHKLYGPKGVGALFMRGGDPQIELEPLIVGGGQERGLRAGTLNVPGIVGFGEACRIAKLEMAEESERIRNLRDRLEEALFAQLPDIWVNGDRGNRLPNTTNIGFAGVDARTLIRDMHDIAVSTKSACSSGSPGPSHVLKAIGLTDDQAYSCIRFSLGRFTTADEIDYAIGKVVSSVRKLRANHSTLTPSQVPAVA